MPFLMFVITTILTLCIGFSLLGLIILEYNHLKSIKEKWPELRNSQLIMRNQKIVNYRMDLNIKNVYQYYEKLIIYAIMLVTLGIIIGGYLIGDLNLTLIPLVVLGLETSTVFFTNLKSTREINESYKNYIRKNLNNELMIVTIPESIINGIKKIKIILGWLLLLESGSILIIILELNQIIS